MTCQTAENKRELEKHHLDRWFVFGNYLTKKQESLILCLDFYYIKGLK